MKKMILAAFVGMLITAPVFADEEIQMASALSGSGTSGAVAGVAIATTATAAATGGATAAEKAAERKRMVNIGLTAATVMGLLLEAGATSTSNH